LTRNVTFLIFPAEDATGQWLGVCLDFDVWTFGGSVASTAQLLEDAVLTTLEDAPIDVLEPAAPEHWHRAHRIMERVAIQAPVAAMDARLSEIKLGVLYPACLTRSTAGEFSFGAPVGSGGCDQKLPAAPQAA